MKKNNFANNCDKCFPQAHEVQIHTSISQVNNGTSISTYGEDLNTFEILKVNDDNQSKVRPDLVNFVEIRRNNESFNSNRKKGNEIKHDLPVVIPIRAKKSQMNTQTIKASIKCILCNLSYGQKSDLNKHIREVHEKKNYFQCPQCSKRYATRYERKKHTELIHEKGKSFKCSKCKMAFGREKDMKKHITEVHEEKKPFQCPMCEVYFIQKGSVKKHIKTVHSQD